MLNQIEKRWASVPNSFVPALPKLEAPLAHVIFVGSDKAGLNGAGKGRPQQFLPVLQYGLHKRGLNSFFYQNASRALEAAATHAAKPTIAVLIYNEDGRDTYPDPALIDQLRREIRDLVIVNEINTGPIVASKPQTNRTLAAHGVKVPSAANRGLAFSTEMSGSNKPAFLVDSSAVDPRRHNTEFIETRREFRGEHFYISLRAAAVGQTMVAAWPRLRAASDGPVVHTKDTPLNPEAIEHFYRELVVDRTESLTEICRRIGAALGLGIFAHDILPAIDGAYYVCETGFKYDNFEVRDHLLPIVTELPSLTDHFSLVIADRAASAIVDECRRIGFLSIED
jgi:hypothetical protein